MTHAGKLYAWEVRTLLRFPMLEVLVAFFVFQAFSLKSVLGSLTVPPGATWDATAGQLALVSAQAGFQTLGDLYLPVAVFASIFATVTLTHDFESGYLKLLLSHPVSRASVFWAKYATIASITFASLVASILLVVFSSSAHDAWRLLDPHTMGLVWLGVLFACLVVTVLLVGVTMLVGTLSKNSALTMAVCIGLTFGALLAGNASHSPLLPPESLSRGDALLFAANPDAGGAYFWPVTISYTLIGLACAGVAAWVFARRVEVS
jgi:ABC-type transport system involved in multi-copper enzyme maturation permease subunit